MCDYCQVYALEKETAELISSKMGKERILVSDCCVVKGYENQDVLDEHICNSTCGLTKDMCQFHFDMSIGLLKQTHTGVSFTNRDQLNQR